jgi:hypothetical protein
MARLTEQQKSTLPPQIRIILERFHHEPRLLAQFRNLLSLSAQKIAQQAINHNTFCDSFQIPNKLPFELLKLYGITEKEFKAVMHKLGFEKNQMFTDLYYQTLTVAYLVGLDFDDKNIRRLALLLIAVRIWNGRKRKYFPTFCDPDIARYVLNYELKGNHTYKRAGNTPFEFLDSYNVPQVDDYASKIIPFNLNNGYPARGLRLLIESEYARINQLFKSIKDAYYRAHQAGKKESVMAKFGQQYGDGEMVEQKETFSGNIERLVDKIEKNAMLKKKILSKSEAKDYLKKKFNISDAGIQKFDEWLDNDENHDDLRYFIELLLNNLKPKSEMDICQYDVSILANKITSAKKDPNLLKAKTIIDQVLQDILGEKYGSLGVQRIYQLKLVAAYALVSYIKILLCKKL